MLTELAFHVSSTLPVTLLESYSMAIGACYDHEVLVYASYLIDLSLLSASFILIKPSVIVICALTLSLQKGMKEDKDDSDTKI